MKDPRLQLWLLAPLALGASACSTSNSAEVEQGFKKAGGQGPDLRLDTPEGAKGTPAMIARVDGRLERIQSENEGLAPEHPFAGSFYKGDGLGENVSLDVAPEAGFTFYWSGCMGLYDLNFGAASFEDGVLELDCELKNERKGFQGIETTLHTIPWGERLYLVAPEEMVQFCNWIHAGHEPRDGLQGPFLMREGDHEKAAPGFPELPGRYASMLLTEPLDVRIVEVGESQVYSEEERYKNRVTRCTIDAGSERGVFAGMRLYPISAPGLPAERGRSTVRVEEVREASAVVSVAAKPDWAMPEEGWWLSTRLR